MAKLVILFFALLAAPAAAVNYTLSISTLGVTSSSVITSSNPATGINCGNGNTACSAVFPSSSNVTLTLVLGTTVTFAGWNAPNGCATNSPSCRVPMVSDIAVTATFQPVFALGLSGNGLGGVSNSTRAISCTATNACASGARQTYSFPQGSVIVLTAVADSSSTFTGWSGDAGCTAASTCTFTLNGYEVLTATFTATGPQKLAVNVRPGGTVKSSPPGINCAGGAGVCVYSFPLLTTVSFTTSAAAGYFFSGWANGGCAGNAPCVVVSFSAQQGLGGAASPSAFFYRLP